MSPHVLVPIDGSEPSWNALDFAAEQHAGGQITVINVVDPVEDIYLGLEGGYYDADAVDRAADRGEELCEKARERFAETGGLDTTDFRTTVETGDPARTIVEYADENGVDHVVIGSHGRTGVARILLGSVAETVARRAPMPVTIVR